MCSWISQGLLTVFHMITKPHANDFSEIVSPLFYPWKRINKILRLMIIYISFQSLISSVLQDFMVGPTFLKTFHNNLLTALQILDICNFANDICICKSKDRQLATLKWIRKGNLIFDYHISDLCSKVRCS